jgi:hypothetical protein
MVSEWFLEHLGVIALAGSRASIIVPKGCFARGLQLAEFSGRVPRSPPVAEAHGLDTLNSGFR